MVPDTIILSPHFDDAVLSCWHLLAGAGKVLVVNVFAGEPPAGTLGWWDQLAGASDSAVAVRARTEEDRRALALADRTAINLPFLDSQYHEPDQAPDEIIQVLRKVLVTGVQIYAPAGLGNHHPDHVAARAAALALHAEGANVALYADLPHATVDGWPQWVLDETSSGADTASERWASQLATTGIPLERMAPTTQRLPAETYARKLEAVLTYSSQARPLQRVFGHSLDDPQLLSSEVTWRLR